MPAYILKIPKFHVSCAADAAAIANHNEGGRKRAASAYPRKAMPATSIRQALGCSAVIRQKTEIAAEIAANGDASIASASANAAPAKYPRPRVSMARAKKRTN